jgi:hypothetical protein
MDTQTPITLVAGGYDGLEPALWDHDAVWAGRREGAFHHSALAVLSQTAEGSFRIERDNNTARYLTWGDAILAGALFLLLPRVRMSLATPDLGGRGAIIRHFHRAIDLDDLVGATALLEDSRFGLVVVLINRTSTEVTPLLTHAARTRAVDLAWGDLEEELRRDLVRPKPELVLVGT